MSEHTGQAQGVRPLRLTYFDMDGGRGETARLALSIGGIAFDDVRIPFARWADVKSTMPLHAIPTLQVGDHTITQSNTINRYVGKLANLYPTDPWQAALCDEVMDAVEDIGTQIVATFPIADPAVKKAARERLAAGPIPLYLTWLQSALRERGGSHFAGHTLSVADLKVLVWIRSLRSGRLDDIPKDLPDTHAPQVVAHCERLNADPRISAYYARRRASTAAS